MVAVGKQQTNPGVVVVLFFLATAAVALDGSQKAAAGVDKPSLRSRGSVKMSRVGLPARDQLHALIGSVSSC